MSFFEIFAIVLAVFAFLLVALVVAVRVFLHRIRNSPEVKAQMARYAASRAAEEALVEEADWFGTTGLPDEDERELPRYLRREFGELVEDEGALQARDLRYVGRWAKGDGEAHYWRIPRRGGEEPAYACITVDGDGTTTCLSWGNDEPPRGRAPLPPVDAAPAGP